MKVIYDRTSIKTSFYSSMGSWKGVTSTLGFVDYKSASPSRNNLILIFQNRNLETLIGSFESHIDDFVALLERNDSLLVDGVVIFRLLALDIVTDVLWGEQDRLLRARQSDGDSNTSSEASMNVFLRRFHAFSTWNATKSFIYGTDLAVRLFGSRK
ncbi:hypothetical protein VHEMI01015 [[Torrubiella] hemipterigena]|uniref:Uncharacterized protein n=1 Tax=[Torrubiella] hemipterigena TaxID=1531966 RepID=A0A0A1T436_9HYPO|nr:hypothetical protein VHEMI01015 [[Torrubiella] hemipterigena]